MGARTDLSTEQLRARAAAFALAARLLGPDVTLLTSSIARSELWRLLEQAGAPPAAERLHDLDLAGEIEADELAGRWVRWFDLGRVAPYEGSNVPPTAGGVTPRLADVAGFYAAFGLKIEHDRPDHLVAELEFMAVLLAAEADARARRDDDGAEVAAGAARAFLRDHLGTWVTAWAARVGDVDDLAPWAPVAAATAELVAVECHDRQVIPVCHDAVLVGDAGVADPDDAIVECGAALHAE